MITYNDIREATRKERYSKQLQVIPKNFVFEVAIYFKEKKEIASKEDDGFSDLAVKTKKQLENAITLFREFMRLRKKKILDLVLIAAETGISKQDFENMFDFEKTLFEDIMKCIDVSDKKFSEILEGRKEGDLINDSVVFLESAEEFVGMDGEMMGPYEKGQIVNIPKEIAKILIDGGKCEVVGE